MTNRFDFSKAPFRAEPRHPAAAAPVQSVPATPGGLIRSTLLAAGAAGAILVLFWLPAEYGIDPTGVGALTGLTEMGEIKQQLAAEAAADAQAAAAAPVAAVEATPATAAPAPEILARLDRIDAQLAAISAVIGTDPNVAFKIGIGEVPLLHQVTFSIWPDTASMAAFARGDGPHGRAIKAVRDGNWFNEELYARFRLLGSMGSWNGVDPLANLTPAKAA